MNSAYSIADLRAAAQRRLPRAIFDFFDGGAEDEQTLSANRLAFQQRRFLPRVLKDVSVIDTRTALFGQPMAMPAAIAPTGALGFGRHGADVAIAKAAVALGIPYTLSSTATASIERIADAAPGRLWFQAYILKDKAFLARLIERARVAEYEALMITVDLPVGGKRERDHRNHFSVPFRFTPKNVVDFAQKPAWCWQMLRQGMPVMENLIGLDEQAKSASSMASSVGRNYDPAFDWDALQRIRDVWPRRLILKGVMHPDDAEQACAIGCDAIVVSNHGGRQLDGAMATLDALPGVVQAVAQRVPVFVDGGVRRGQDVVKALALGAHGVLLGRATLFGAVSDGERGAARALEILQTELVRTMQLCGVRNVGEINATLMGR
jgi:(S)-mandelate dehydrogenase